MDSPVLLLILLLFLHILFYAFIAIKIFRIKNQYKSSTDIGISIIIAAKNELENLVVFIPSWLDLQYPNYEIIVVLNQTTDDSYQFLHSLNHPRLKVYQVDEIPKGVSPKKMALTHGVQMATYDYIVFTDADCKPSSNQFLNYYLALFQQGYDIILGIGKYENQPTFLNAIIQWETFWTALLYIGLNELKLPYMCVGRNWGLTKSTFYKNDGFASHLHILAGDDDLFIQNLKTPSKFASLIHPNAQTISRPKTTFFQWLNQKKRHLATSKYYRLKSKFILSGIHLYLFITFFSLFAIYSYTSIQNFFLILCAYSLTINSIFMIINLQLNIKVPLAVMLLHEPLRLVYHVALSPILFLTKKITWK